MQWRKSTRSNSDGACVEVAVPDTSTVMMRDSKDKTGPVLAFDQTAWAEFIEGVKQGEFDL